MILNCRFAVISDPHIALPHTIWDHPSRFHLVEISIPALEMALEHLGKLDLDFLLIPGDLTQHGESDNHNWLQKRLALLPFSVYVVPGNHDIPHLLSIEKTIGLKDFPFYYQQFGYQNPQQIYYTYEVLPGLQLIALNSNQFDNQGKQIGCLDQPQLIWLEKTLEEVKDKFVLLMIHHNVVEHLPGQSRHEMGKRYMLDNASMLLKMLRKFGVKLIFSGHLHIQDVVKNQGIYEITTGSLVSYPHPYRLLQLEIDTEGESQLEIESYQVKSLEGWENLSYISKEWMGDRSFPFMLRLLTSPPLNLPLEEAQQLAPQLRYFWSDIAVGDTIFDFPDFPKKVRRYFQQFSALNSDGTPVLIDNNATLILK